MNLIKNKGLPLNKATISIKKNKDSFNLFLEQFLLVYKYEKIELWEEDFLNQGLF